MGDVTIRCTGVGDVTRLLIASYFLVRHAHFIPLIEATSPYREIDQNCAQEISLSASLMFQDVCEITILKNVFFYCARLY